MRLPRKGILIRLLIYIPLLTYFGWAAYQKWSAPPPAEGPALEGPKKVFTLPNGKTVEVVEISEEQARQMGLDVDAKAPPADEKKAPAAPAPAAGN